MISNT
jgi:hypothetical protein